MTATMGLKVGPARFKVVSSGRWGDQLRKHLSEFAEPATNSSETSFTLHETLTASDHLGRRLRPPSKEVKIHYSNTSGTDVFASSAITPRSAMRFVKRLPDIEFWQRSRWLLFLRNALEMPLLASLEYQYGFVPLHAATVYGPTGAVVILGVNGAGKSTLAYRLTQSLNVKLASDNFSPCDGNSVAGFPGAPKPKPGTPSIPIHPHSDTVSIRGIVTAGFGLGTSKSGRRESINDYFASDREGHRGTCWDEVFHGGAVQEAHNNKVVSGLLTEMPNVKYQWQRDSFVDVEHFVGVHCGI